MNDERLGLAFGVDLVENFFGDAPIVLLQRADGAIDRIGDAGAGRQLERGQRVERRLAERCHVEAEPREAIGREHARAAAVAEQHDAAGRVLRLRGQRLEYEQRVDEIVERIDQYCARLARKCDPRALIARERARVRSRGGESLARAAALQHDDRLPRFRRAQQIEETPSVLGGFNIEADHLRLCIGEIELKHVAGAQIGTVADGNEAGKLYTPAQAAADDIGAKPAALRYHADRADFSGADFGKGDSAARRVDAQAVRAKQAHAARARAVEQSLLQVLSFIDFAEAARNHLRKTHAARGGRQHVRHLRRGYRDVSVIDHLRSGGQTWISCEAVDLRRGRVDRIDLAGKAELAYAAYEYVRQGRALGRCANYRNRLRHEQRRVTVTNCLGDHESMNLASTATAPVSDTIRGLISASLKSSA